MLAGTMFTDNELEIIEFFNFFSKFLPKSLNFTLILESVILSHYGVWFWKIPLCCKSAEADLKM